MGVVKGRGVVKGHKRGVLKGVIDGRGIHVDVFEVATEVGVA